MLPFALVDDLAWFAVPVVTLVTFTLYGIDGIGTQLEDPFSFDRNAIKMDLIVEDIRSEVGVLLEEWRRAGGDENGNGEGEMFIRKRGGGGERGEERAVKDDGIRILEDDVV